MAPVRHDRGVVLHLLRCRSFKITIVKNMLEINTINPLLMYLLLCIYACMYGLQGDKIGRIFEPLGDCRLWAVFRTEEAKKNLATFSSLNIFGQFFTN
jgi:hypothetical protein